MVNGFEIFLPFKQYADYLRLTTEATKSQDWVAWVAWAQKNRIVVKWECTDRDGNALDPDKKEDWDKMSTGAVAHLIKAVQDHVRGTNEAAKN